MARPRKADHERRTDRIAPRFTPSEGLTILHAAAVAGLSPTDYVRTQALQGRVVVRESRALDHAAFDELRRIGINLNQLARIANTTGRVPAELAGACAAVDAFLSRELAGHGAERRP